MCINTITTLTKPLIRSNLAGHCCWVVHIHSVLLHLQQLLTMPASHGNMHQTQACPGQHSRPPALPLHRVFAHAGPMQGLMQGKSSMPPQGQTLPGIHVSSCAPLHPSRHPPEHPCILLGCISLGIPPANPISSWASCKHPFRHPCILLGIPTSTQASPQAFPYPSRHHCILLGTQTQYRATLTAPAQKLCLLWAARAPASQS